VQLPTHLPLAGGEASERKQGARTSGGVSKADYLAALSSANASSAGDTDSGGPGSGAPSLAGLADLQEGQLGELLVLRSGKVMLSIDGFLFDVHQGTECTFDQELVAISSPEGQSSSTSEPQRRAGERPVDIHRLGKLHERLILTPNVDSLLAAAAEP